jgi:hypothetical protein
MLIPSIYGVADTGTERPGVGRISDNPLLGPLRIVISAVSNCRFLVLAHAVSVSVLRGVIEVIA